MIIPEPFRGEAQTALCFKDPVHFISLTKTNHFMVYGIEVAVPR